MNGSRLAQAIGSGVLAGIAGTAAITLSSTVEAHWRGRPASDAPARATTRVLGISGFQDEQAAQRFSDLSHWGYGIGWGVARGMLGLSAIAPARATALHGALVWGTAQITLPALDVAPPIVFWAPEEIAIDLLHHGVYALATGAAYGLLTR